MLVIDDITIPMSELELQYVRSRGPGGQNVNKVATKAVLRWNVTDSPSLPDTVRRRFLELHANRINKEVELVLSSDRFRSQSRNSEDCLDRLRELVAEAIPEPVIRKKRKPSKGAKRRRLEDKRRQSQKKRNRRPVSEHD